MNKTKYDIAILGAGPGGYVSAIRAAQLGAKVALIEKDKVGGVCLNKGCIPTKSILSSLNIYEKIKEAENFGIDIKGTVHPNLAKIIERKNKIVLNSIKGIEYLLKTNKVDFFKGNGIITSPESIIITGRQKEEKIYTSNIIIATGSSPQDIENFSFDSKYIISSDEALNETTIPKHILIVGAGAIGCEWAFIYNSLGAEVSIIEALPRPINTLDEDVSKLIEKEFKKRKINLHTNTSLKNTANAGGRLKAVLGNGQELNPDKVLISIGRKFNSYEIGLEGLNISTNTNGQIIVNERLQTNIENIYAIGDVIGGKMLAHKASYDGILAVENILTDNKDRDYTFLPSVIFTKPEIGCFGLTENEAKDKNLNYKTGFFPFRASGKAAVLGDIDGFIKIIVLKDSNKIIGASIAGPSATELIHEVAVLAQNDMPIESIIKTIHGHPTLSESIKEAAEDIFGKAIHFFSRQL